MQPEERRHERAAPHGAGQAMPDEEDEDGVDDVQHQVRHVEPARVEASVERVIGGEREPGEGMPDAFLEGGECPAHRREREGLDVRVGGDVGRVVPVEKASVEHGQVGNRRDDGEAERDRGGVGPGGCARNGRRRAGRLTADGRRPRRCGEAESLRDAIADVHDRALEPAIIRRRPGDGHHHHCEETDDARARRPGLEMERVHEPLDRQVRQVERIRPERELMRRMLDRRRQRCAVELGRERQQRGEAGRDH